MRATAQERKAGAGRGGLWGSVKVFFRDAWLELKKVIWPSHDQVVKMTGLVVVVVMVVSGFIFVWDRLLMVVTRPMFE
jgi:preprotein translocase SecE subunit